MEKKITNINDLVLFLSGAVTHTLLADNMWQKFGFKRRPKKGNIWNRIFPNKYALDILITKEIITMCLIDVLNGIKKSTKSKKDKILIAIGVIDKFLYSTEHFFDHSILMTNIFDTYSKFLNSEQSKHHEIFIDRAKLILNKKQFVIYTIGIIKLLSIPSISGDILLISDDIKDIINDSSTENKLEVKMPKEIYIEYEPMIIEKILDI